MGSLYLSYINKSKFEETMINKYTLGTVLGTALLGVAKSKLGSGIRLKLLRYPTSYIEFTVTYLTSEMALEELETTDEIIEHVEGAIEGFTIRDGDDEILYVQIVNLPYLDDEGERSEHVVFKIGITYTNHGDQEELMSYHQQQRIIEFYKEKLQEDPLGYADIIDDYPPYNIWQYGEINKIVNADTGEEYVAPVKNPSKLRKR